MNKAIKRLENKRRQLPNNSVVIFNLASCYLEINRPEQAAKLLDLYLRDHPVIWDGEPWSMLTSKQGMRPICT